MKNKKLRAILIRIGITLISVLVWLAVWQTIAAIINKEAFLAGIPKTMSALISMLITLDFWKTLLFSLLRIIYGFIFGVAAGTLLAALCHACPPINTFISLGMSVIKATPVASIIMIIWIFVGSDSVPSVIALLMVTPIIWQNLTDGFKSINKDLTEVADAFELSHAKRFKLIILPSLLNYFVPALLTSISLAWKSGIAAEIIAGTRDSIGEYIKSNKNTFDSDYMLAWTLVVILISLAFEQLIKFLSRRYKANAPHT